MAAELPAEADVVIVGAGPAGLAAAAELRALGMPRVLVLDRAREAGGVPRVCAHSPYGFREFRRLMFGPAYARALRDRAFSAGARIVTGAAVSRLLPGPRVEVTTDATGMIEIHARAVLLATGTRERARSGRLIGGTKPGGVMVTGALQNLVYGGHRRPFRRPVILGTELVSFSAILTCKHAGIRPAAMVEPGTRITARRYSAELPRVRGIPPWTNTEVIAVEGADAVTAIHVRQGTTQRQIEADGLVTTGCFRPEAHLAQIAGLEIDPGTGGPAVDDGGRTSAPGVYAAGNVLRPVETAGWCWREGLGVARVIAADLATRSRPELERAPIVVSGSALRYVMPKYISGADTRAFDVLQARVMRPVKGRLGVCVGTSEFAGRRLDTLPERRLTLALPRVSNQTMTVRLEDDARHAHESVRP
ncbi:MAG: FAD/NAD(P)-binding oxidoreductase [Pseudomonadota bacterium]